MKLSEAIKLRKIIEEAAQGLSDDKAVKAKMLYPRWENLIGETIEAGTKVQFNGELYKTKQTHTVQADWTPDVAVSLYEKIDEQHEGTLTDPIPYNGNMELVEGLYYEQFEKIYECTRPTGQAVYHNLADLVGVYVSEVAR